MAIEQRSVIKSLVAEKCKRCEIYKEYVMGTEKHILVQKVYERPKHGFTYTNLFRKDRIES